MSAKDFSAMEAHYERRACDERRKQMTPGFYTAADLSNQAYHYGPGVSNSMLKLISDRSPAHLYAQYLHPDRPRSSSSRAKFIGSAIHAAALEPDKFEQEYVVAHDFDTRGQAGYKAWEKNVAGGRLVLTNPEFQNIQGMHRALYGHPVAGALLRDAFEYEYSAYANDPDTGLLCRARLDVMTSGGWIVDLKKCQDASAAAFARTIANFGYYHQDAFYTDVITWACGVEPAGFAFVCVEEDPPHAVGVYVLVGEDRQRGRELYRKNLNTYAICASCGHWPGYSTQAEYVELSAWDRKRIDRLISHTGE